MSGGHYDYGYKRINQLAYDIEADCNRNKKAWKDDWGDEHPAIPEDILANMRAFVVELRTVADLAHDLEWYRSGDIGEDGIRIAFKDWAKP